MPSIKQSFYRMYNSGGAVSRKAVKSMLKLVYWNLNRSMLSRQAVSSSIEQFRPGLEQKQKKRLAKVCYRECLKYYFRPDEYFLYHFDSIEEDRKNEFLADNQRGIYTVVLNEPDKAGIFRDKAACYQYFKPYYRRELLCVSPDTTEEAIRTFCSAYPRIVLKAVKGSHGRGVSVLSTENMEEVVNSVRELGVSVIEPVVKQCEFMNALHPQSLNTVRVPTFLHEGGHVEIIRPILRIGRGDSFVDNAGSGGIFACIDPQSGEVVTDAVDEFGNRYAVHPDTGFRFKGLVIPRWDELVALAAELAAVVPTVRLVGFDLALTDDGWLMIEGNNNPQPGQQIADQIGMKSVYEKMT